MTKEELMNLTVGTLIYNGKYEATVEWDGYRKGIGMWIAIEGMSNYSQDYNERPENCSVLEE